MAVRVVSHDKTQTERTIELTIKALNEFAMTEAADEAEVANSAAWLASRYAAEVEACRLEHAAKGEA